MKKLFYFLFALITSTAIQAQFITTNPATTPVTLGSDLNMAAGKIINFNSIPTIKSFGTGNLGLGAYAFNTGTSGTNNVAVGAGAGQTSPSGNSNAFVGTLSGYGSIGNQNSAIGGSSLGFNTGNDNTAIGFNAGLNNHGLQNVFIGQGAGQSNSGNSNVIIGVDAGSVNTGVGNTFVGYNSGINHTTGLGNLYLGAYSGSANASRIGATAIGLNSKVEQDYAIVIGQTGNNLVLTGIGTSTPTDKLHVNGTVRFQGLPTDAPGGTAVQYLVADATGKVYLYTGTAPARQGVSENSAAVIPTSFTDNWTLKNDFLYNKNKKGIIIGEGISVLPKGYGMFVTDGILTEKVKVAIKNSADWADYVFNKDYKKMTLTEVEKFIKVNNHLPNMLSATEMITEGNDLAKTDAKLLAKIEELTLYMIDMKKENTQMKRQINSLKRKINK